ncbi:MAG: ParA family protein [Phycisphaerae bacterium]|nr:ParA family protein [Phycisphaerae bacterium]
MPLPPAPNPPRPVRLIALMNQKGGVGKTTTTVNLAAAFARAGRSTLVVDLDPQAHASLHLGIEGGQDSGADRASIYDCLIDPAFDATSALVEASPNLWVLPSTTDLAAAETELAAIPEREKRLERVLASLGGRFEFVLIDCPPSLGLLTINALAAAREVLIPMQAHFLALQGVGKLLETVGLVSKAINPKLRVAGVVLCAHDASSTHTREVVADMDSFFEQARQAAGEGNLPWKFARVFRPAIRRNIKLAECPSFGKTIFDYAPQAPGAEDYAALGEALLRDWDAMLAKRAPETGAMATPPATPQPTPQVVTIPSAPRAEAAS